MKERDLLDKSHINEKLRPPMDEMVRNRGRSSETSARRLTHQSVRSFVRLSIHANPAKLVTKEFQKMSSSAASVTSSKPEVFSLSKQLSCSLLIPLVQFSPSQPARPGQEKKAVFNLSWNNLPRTGGLFVFLAFLLWIDKTMQPGSVLVLTNLIRFILSVWPNWLTGQIFAITHVCRVQREKKWPPLAHHFLYNQETKKLKKIYLLKSVWLRLPAKSEVNINQGTHPPTHLSSRLQRWPDG